MNIINSPLLGLYLMGVFLNTVLFVFSYDVDGVAKKLCVTKTQRVIGIISILFYVPFIVFLLFRYRGKNIG